MWDRRYVEEKGWDVSQEADVLRNGDKRRMANQKRKQRQDMVEGTPAIDRFFDTGTEPSNTKRLKGIDGKMSREQGDERGTGEKRKQKCDS